MSLFSRKPRPLTDIELTVEQMSQHARALVAGVERRADALLRKFRETSEESRPLPAPEVKR